MIVHGKERLFKLTVGASLAIAELCPNGDLDRLSEVLKGSTAQIMSNAVKIIVALQHGYEDARAVDEPGYVPDYMTEAELYAIDMDDFKAFEREAVAVYNGDSSPTVDVESKKK